MIYADIVIKKGNRMDHKKLEQFAEITAAIGSSIDTLLKAQELLVQLMCEQCTIPIDMKQDIINNMNHIIGIKKNEPI